MKLQVSLRDALDFFVCWESVIDNKSYTQPYNENREALVFSFDGELKAFLNFTKGYHRSGDKRPYFARLPRIMNDIRKLMYPYRDLGGRVFLDGKRANYVDRNSNHHHLCEISWPQEIDVVAIVKKLRPRFSLTLTVPVLRATNRPPLKK